MAITIEKFEKRWIPEPFSGCWLWTGRMGGTGNAYGTVHVTPNQSLYAHRLSWILHRGDIPKGLHVCHKCDTPSCVNPEHLFLGTDADNHADRFKKGRFPITGINNPMAKLTWEKVKKIRNSSGSQRSIAKRYGVSQGLISQVLLGKIWKDGIPI